MKTIEDSRIHYKNKEELTDFGFRSKRVSVKAFSNAQNLLSQMKQIKRSHMAAATEPPAPSAIGPA